MNELDVFKAVRAGCTTRPAIIKHLQAKGYMHPNMRRFVDRALHKLRRERRIEECNTKRHGRTGWFVKEQAHDHHT